MNMLLNGINNQNFTQMAQMIELNKLQADLVQKTIKKQLERNRQKYGHPSIIGKAKVHRQAAKFGYSQALKGQTPTVCPCCLMRINKQSIPLCYNTTNLKTIHQQGYQQFKLSSGVALYFFFIKSIIFYLFLHCLLSSSFNCITNYIYGSQCSKLNSSSNTNTSTQSSSVSCQLTIWSLLSIENKKNNNNLLFIQDIINLVTIIISIIFFLCYRKQQYNMNKIIDQHHQTQDDYTLVVKNIPIMDFPKQQQNSKQSRQFYYRKHLQIFFQNKITTWLNNSKNWIIENGTVQQDFKKLLQQNQGQLKSSEIIRSITLCYNLSRLEILNNSRQILINQYQQQNDSENNKLIQQIDHKKKYNQRFQTIPGRVDFINDCQVILNTQFATDNSFLFNLTHFVGIALISFQYQHYKQYILSQAEKNSKFLLYNSKQLKVQKATNPNDVYWKNLRIINRKQRTLISFGILIMVLIFSFGILTSLEYLKDYQNSHLNSKQVSINMNLIISYIFTLPTIILIILINQILQFIILKLTDFEKHQTRTNAKFSLIVKLLITQFINTALIYYTIFLILDRKLMEKLGLVYQISSLIIISGIIQICINLIFPHAILRSLKLWFKYRSKQNDQSIDQFQIKLNSQFQYVQFNLATQYTYYLVQLYTALFYSYLIPVGVIATLIIFILQYWIDKYNLFRRSTLYYNFNFYLSTYILKLMEISILLFATGNFIFSIYTHNFTITPINIAGLALSFLFVIFSLLAPSSLERKIFGRYQFSEKITYDDCVADGKFEVTYWTQNPATYLVQQSSVTSKRTIVNPATAQIFAGIDTLFK